MKKFIFNRFLKQNYLFISNKHQINLNTILIKRCYNINKTKKKESNNLFIYILSITSLFILSYGAYRILLSNIHKFPPEVRAELRNALWAKNKEKDLNTSEVHLKAAIDSMVENSKIDNNSWLLIGTILELAEVYKMNNKPTEAIQSFEQALVHLDQNDNIELNSKDSMNTKNLKEEEKNKNKALGIYLELYRLYLKTNDIVQSNQKIEKAVELILNDYLDNSNKGNTYHELNHKIKKPSWLTNQEYLAAVEEIGSYYIKTEGFHPAMVLYQLALNNANDPIKKSILYCNLGVAYQGLKYSEFALNAFKQGILILKQVKDVENENKDKNMTTLLYNLGLTYELSGNKEEAKKYFQQLWKNRGNCLKHMSKKKWKVVKDCLDK